MMLLIQLEVMNIDIFECASLVRLKIALRQFVQNVRLVMMED